MGVDFGYDTTNGVIVGGDEIRYEFWQENKILHDIGYKGETGKGVFEKVAVEYFECGHDQEAIDWFAANYPEAWNDRKARPIEMRVHDQPGKMEAAMIKARQPKQGEG